MDSPLIAYAYAFDGPNLYRPTPGVALGVLSEGDCRQQLAAQLKHYAMQVGLVLGQLHIATKQQPHVMLTELDFATPSPTIALELALLAAESCFAEQEHSQQLEEALWQLQQRQRAEALPLWAIQLLAEARRRSIPAFRWQAGLQLGYGARGMYLPVQSSADGRIMPETIAVRGQAAAETARPSAIDWQRLGTIPILAISGGSAQQRQSLLEPYAQLSEAADQQGTSTFEAIRAILANPATHYAVVSLESSVLLTRGLPFEQCHACILLAPQQIQANSAIDDEALLRIIGLPLLVTDRDGIAALELEDWQAAVLKEYAPCKLGTRDQALSSLLKTISS